MRQAMPPRSSLTSSFSVSDASNEVLCPLQQSDGTPCRKRCTGEKRYRSMQEHIRRAHPEHYISKLPATEESFVLMINTPPSERPPPTANSSGPGYSTDGSTYRSAPKGSSGLRRTSHEYYQDSPLPAASAAAALAQLHNHRPESEWDSDHDAMSDYESKLVRPVDLPTLNTDLKSDPFPPYQLPRPRELLPSILSHSPPGRSSTLPPIQRRDKGSRPRKSSVSQNARKPKHERTKSKEHARKMSYEGRKALSAEPSSLFGKRWEDLIDAAASATEEEEDRTPQPPSPPYMNRASLPPLLNHRNYHSYHASPLQRALTPPPLDNDTQPFPSVESSMQSSIESTGSNFHMGSHGLLSDSSPTSAHQVQIYCAACQNPSFLKESYACTECICGICHDCVAVLASEQSRGRAGRCPRCGTLGGRFKPFQLDIR